MLWPCCEPPLRMALSLSLQLRVCGVVWRRACACTRACMCGSRPQVRREFTEECGAIEDEAERRAFTQMVDEHMVVANGSSCWKFVEVPQVH